MDAFLLQASIWAPLACALPLLAGARLPRAAVQGIALAGFSIPFLISLWLWFQFPAGGGAEFHFRSTHDLGLGALAGIRLDLGLNGISLPFFVLAGVVGLAAGLYAIHAQAERLHLYLLLLLVMQSGLMGVFASIDIFFFYLFHEFAMIPTFIMIGLWGGKDRAYAAMKMAIYLTLGAMLSLAGLIVVYSQSGAGAFNLEQLRTAIESQSLSETVQIYGFGLLLFGFGILVSLWPLHTWAPLGYGAAPTANAMLHAGVLKKFGIYGFVQIAVPLMPFGSQYWQMPLAWLALGNVIIIGYVTVAQKDLKQMIGYSSVMHMGYCFLGVACLSAVGAGGAVLLCVAHGLSVAVLFLLATCIHKRSRTFEMDDMGGMVKQTPVLAAFFATAILASIGLPGPGLANFWGELTVFMALYEAREWMVVPAVFGVVISAVYGLRALAKVFYGQPSEAFQRSLKGGEIQDMTWNEKLPAGLLVAALVFVGVWPKSLSDSTNEALSSYAQRSKPALNVSVETPESLIPAATETR
jgi:NADH-quinone oxidoreductase subunit M